MHQKLPPFNHPDVEKIGLLGKLAGALGRERKETLHLENHWRSMAMQRLQKHENNEAAKLLGSSVWGRMRTLPSSDISYSHYRFVEQVEIEHFPGVHDLSISVNAFSERTM
jgi:hypothetical protein